MNEIYIYIKIIYKFFYFKLKFITNVIKFSSKLVLMYIYVYIVFKLINLLDNLYYD